MAVVHDADPNWKNYALSLKAQFVQTDDPNGNEFTILVRTNHFVRNSQKCSGQAYQIIFNGPDFFTPNTVLLLRTDYDIGGCYDDRSFTVLAQTSMSLSLEQMDVKVAVDGPKIRLWIEGEKIFDVSDPDPFLYGGIGVHTVWELSSRFDDVEVVSQGSTAVN